ncbi:MAG: diguanylate cyclase [Betaproteobacteria bacterium]
MAFPHVHYAAESPPQYVLLASDDLAQAAKWLAAIGETGAEIRIAHDGERGLEILARTGAPILLITDLALPNKDGFALAEALRQRSGPDTSILIGVSRCRELLDRARARRDLGFAAVLSASDVDALGVAVRRALRSIRVPAQPQAVVSPASDRSAVESVMREIADEAVRLTRVPGVVLYLQAGSSERFRANLTWVSEKDRRSPLSTAHVFRTMVESVRGIVATAIPGEQHGKAIGVLCVFDIGPLALGAREIDALRDLAGRAGRRLQQLVERAVPERHEFSLAPSPSLPPTDIAALSRLALADPLTGLANRRGGELSIDREVARARREGRPLSVLFLDVDRFKIINDVGGHLLGDHVLRGVSETLTRVLRRSDLAIRWGGEEFVVILPNVRLQEARRVAERVRVAMQDIQLDSSRVTVSGGVAEMTEDEDFTSVLKRADDQLRAAKQQGRNRIF